MTLEPLENAPLVFQKAVGEDWN